MENNYQNLLAELIQNYGKNQYIKQTKERLFNLTSSLNVQDLSIEKRQEIIDSCKDILIEVQANGFLTEVLNSITYTKDDTYPTDTLLMFFIRVHDFIGFFKVVNFIFQEQINNFDVDFNYLDKYGRNIIFNAIENNLNQANFAALLSKLPLQQKTNYLNNFLVISSLNLMDFGIVMKKTNEINISRIVNNLIFTVYNGDIFKFEQLIQYNYEALLFVDTFNRTPLDIILNEYLLYKDQKRHLITSNGSNKKINNANQYLSKYSQFIEFFNYQKSESDIIKAIKYNLLNHSIEFLKILEIITDDVNYFNGEKLSLTNSLREMMQNYQFHNNAIQYNQNIFKNFETDDNYHTVINNNINNMIFNFKLFNQAHLLFKKENEIIKTIIELAGYNNFCQLNKYFLTLDNTILQSLRVNDFVNNIFAFNTQQELKNNIQNCFNRALFEREQDNLIEPLKYLEEDIVRVNNVLLKITYPEAVNAYNNEIGNNKILAFRTKFLNRVTDICDDRAAEDLRIIREQFEAFYLYRFLNRINNSVTINKADKDAIRQIFTVDFNQHIEEIILNRLNKVDEFLTLDFNTRNNPRRK